MKKRFLLLGTVLLGIISIKLSPLKGRVYTYFENIIPTTWIFNRISSLEFQQRELVREVAENTAKNLIVVNIRRGDSTKTAKALAIKYVKNQNRLTEEELEILDRGLRHHSHRHEALRAVRDFYAKYYDHASDQTIEKTKEGIEALKKKIERILGKGGSHE